MNASTVPIVGTKLNASSFPRDIPIGFIDDLILSIPYPVMNVAAAREMRNSAFSIPARIDPNPNTPIEIRNASQKEQTRQTAKTCDFSKPCLTTKIFCGPMARIRPKLRANPSMPADQKSMT